MRSAVRACLSAPVECLDTHYACGAFSVLSYFHAFEYAYIRSKLNRLIKPFFGSGLDFFMREKVDLSTITITIA